MKDWTGDSRSVYTAIGASNHSAYERQQHDYYATEPRAVHLSKVLERAGYDVLSTDIVYRGYGYPASVDFLSEREANSFDGDIITNPPYKYALEFVKQAIRVVKPNNKVAMFLKLTFLEGQKRRSFFKTNPPKTVYVSSSRLICARNGDFEKFPHSAIAYAWFVWEKGYSGNTVIKWIN